MVLKRHKLLVLCLWNLVRANRVSALITSIYKQHTQFVYTRNLQHKRITNGQQHQSFTEAARNTRYVCLFICT